LAITGENNDEVFFDVDVLDNAKKIVQFTISGKELSSEDLRVKQARQYFSRIHKGTFQVPVLKETLTNFVMVANMGNQAPKDEALCLLVDDDDVVLKIMKKRLSKLWTNSRKPITILTANTGHEALELVAVHQPKRFSFVTVDLNLSSESKLTGQETADKIRDLSCADKVFTMTASPPQNSGETILSKADPQLYEKIMNSFSEQQV